MKKSLKNYLSSLSKPIKLGIAGLGLLGIVSSTSLPPLHAEEVYSKENKNDYKIEASIDVFPYTLQLQGLEEEMGKSGEIYDEWSYDRSFDYSNWENCRLEWNEKENYGSQLNPIKVNPVAGTLNIQKTLIKPKVSLYTPSKVGFHAQGWMLSGSDSKSGEVPGYSFEFESESSSEPGLYTYHAEDKFSMGLVSMWDEIFDSFWGEYKETWTENPDGWWDVTWEEK